MKMKFYSRVILFALIVVGFNDKLIGQTTETFEDEVTPTTQFTDNSQIFNFGGSNAFQVFTQGGVNHNKGYNGSDQYIDNGGNGIGFNIDQINSIKTANGAIFAIKSMWVFVSSDAPNYNLPTNDGSLIFRGKLGGVTQFTGTKSSGFATVISGVPNGYTFINFATAFSGNYSNVPIDEIEIEMDGAFQYISVDDFTWALSTLPVNLISYTATLQNNKTNVNWVTAGELNSSHFTLEKSTDGTIFTQVANIRGKGTTSLVANYSYVDESPDEGINYYRLKQYDFDGKVKDHGIRTVNVNGVSTSLKAYPNPMTLNTLTIQNESSAIGSAYHMVDISGRTVLAGKITQVKQDIDVSGLQKGMFILQLSNGKSLKLFKN